MMNRTKKLELKSSYEASYTQQLAYDEEMGVCPLAYSRSIVITFAH